MTKANTQVFSYYSIIACYLIAAAVALAYAVASWQFSTALVVGVIIAAAITTIDGECC